jgi:hypothetical protein
MKLDQFEIHPMDRRTLRMFDVAIESAAFEVDYREARRIWEDVGRQRGGLYDATLFAMAMKHQVKAPEPENVVVEELPPIPPVHKTTKKKQLAKA